MCSRWLRTVLSLTTSSPATRWSCRPRCSSSLARVRPESDSAEHDENVVAGSLGLRSCNACSLRPERGELLIAGSAVCVARWRQGRRWSDWPSRGPVPPGRQKEVLPDVGAIRAPSCSCRPGRRLHVRVVPSAAVRVRCDIRSIAAYASAAWEAFSIVLNSSWLPLSPASAAHTGADPSPEVGGRRASGDQRRRPGRGEQARCGRGGIASNPPAVSDYH
jgi:hypothetical protein